MPPAAAVQTVVFGSATKQFARNTVMTHRPDVAGSSTRAYEAEEVDMNDLGTRDYGASWHGYTVHYTPAGIVPAGSGQPAHNVRPTSDSYGINISGPLPTLLQLQSGIAGTKLIDSDSLRLLVGASPPPPVGSQNLLSDRRRLRCIWGCVTTVRSACWMEVAREWGKSFGTRREPMAGYGFAAQLARAA